MSYFASANNEQNDLRIVALAPHIVEMLFDIGAGEQIVGTVEYADYPKQANLIPRVGGHHSLQVEKILALQPDLVIAWQSGNNSDDLAQLKRLGINVVYSNPGKVDDVAASLRHFGKLLHKEQQAEQVAQAFEQRLASIREKYQHKSKVKVFYQLWSAPMMTINKNTLIHQLIGLCQGHNVFANNPTDYPQISVENVMLLQPEVIILPDEKSDKPQPVVNWQKWLEIPAVKANAFIHVNADLLHRFSTRMLTGVEDMCQQIEQTRSALTDHSSSS